MTDHLTTQLLFHLSFIFRHGHGKMVYKDKRVYEGEWNRDRRHGFGTLTFPGSKGKVGLSFTAQDLSDENDLC